MRGVYAYLGCADCQHDDTFLYFNPNPYNENYRLVLDDDDDDKDALPPYYY